VRKQLQIFVVSHCTATHFLPFVTSTEDCVLFREYSIDGIKKKGVSSEVQDPFRDSEWIKTTGGKGGLGGGVIQSGK